MCNVLTNNIILKTRKRVTRAYFWSTLWSRDKASQQEEFWEIAGDGNVDTMKKEENKMGKKKSE